MQTRRTQTQTRAQTGCDLSSGCTTATATAVPLETTSEASGAISRMSINTIFQFRLLQQSRLLFCWHEIAISYIDVTLYMYVRTYHSLVLSSTYVHIFAIARMCVSRVPDRARLLAAIVVLDAWCTFFHVKLSEWSSCQSTVPCFSFFVLMRCICLCEILEFATINHGG